MASQTGNRQGGWTTSGRRESGCVQGMIETRAATPDERDELLRLIRGHLGADFESLQGPTGLSWPEFEALYRTRGEVRAIRKDGSVVGYYWIERRGKELHLHAIYVFPPHRDKGVAAAAIGALEREFETQVDAIELGVEETNKKARSLYERLGFQVEGRLVDLGFLLLRKRLRDRAGN